MDYPDAPLGLTGRGEFEWARDTGGRPERAAGIALGLAGEQDGAGRDGAAQALAPAQGCQAAGHIPLAVFVQARHGAAALEHEGWTR